MAPATNNDEPDNNKGIFSIAWSGIPLLIVCLIGLWATTTSTTQTMMKPPAAGNNKPYDQRSKPVTILSCSFPTNLVPFGVVSSFVSLEQQEGLFMYTGMSTSNPELVTPPNEVGLSFNAVLKPQSTSSNSNNNSTTSLKDIRERLTYSSDKGGSVAVYLGTSGQEDDSTAASTPLIDGDDGASLSDHARWSPKGDFIVFQSTRQRNPTPLKSWSAIYIYDVATKTTSRLTPEATWTTEGGEFSPAISPDGLKIAVTVGTGLPEGKDRIVLYEKVIVEEKENSHHQWVRRGVVASNGGWPAWHGNDAIVFHRSPTGAVEEPWDLVRVTLNPDAPFSNGDKTAAPLAKSERTLLSNGMTPFILDNTLVFAYMSGTFHRQIAVVDLSILSAQNGGVDTGATATLPPPLPLTFDETHHYNPSIAFTAEKKNSEISFVLLYHQCRCNTASPNIRHRNSPIDDVGLAFVYGDFPAVSPDFKKLTMVSQNFKSLEIYNIDGSNPKTLSSHSAWMTSFSPNGTLAFTDGPGFSRSTNGKVQIATFDPTFQKKTRLNEKNNTNQGYPSFSPTGEHIVYRTSNGMHDHNDLFGGLDGIYPGTYHLEIMDVDGKNVRPLTPTSADYKKGNNNSSSKNENDVKWNETNIGDTHPFWAANDLVVFASDRGHPNRLTIWSINANGTNMREVFDHGTMSVHPTIIPPSEHTNRYRLVFSSMYAGCSMEKISWPFSFVFEAELFMTELDGSNLVRLTHDGGEEANAFAMKASLPKTLSREGPSTMCHKYRDVTHAPHISAYMHNKSPRPIPHGFGAIPPEDEEDTADMKKSEGEKGTAPTPTQATDSGESEDGQPRRKKETKRPGCPFGFGRS